MGEQVGIIVHGSNHFIVRGPLPSKECARALVREWSLVRIGACSAFTKWRISTKEFREDLEWAVWLEGEDGVTEAVRQLIGELEARGVAVHRAPGPFLPPDSSPSWPGEECA